MAERPDDAHPDDAHPADDAARGAAPDATRSGEPGFAAANGWDREYETFSDFELPTYVGPTTFMNLPWVTDVADLHAQGRRRRDRRRAVRRRRQPPARRALRAPRDPRGAVHLGLDQLAPAGGRAVRGPPGRRRRRREHRAGLDRAGPRPDLPQGPRGREHRRDPDRPGRRPLDHVAVGDRGRGGPPAGQHRHRPLRRPRRHRERRLGRPRRPRDADAAAHRVRRGRRPQLRPGRAARLLAAGRRRSSGCRSTACATTS